MAEKRSNPWGWVLACVTLLGFSALVVWSMSFTIESGIETKEKAEAAKQQMREVIDQHKATQLEMEKTRKNFKL